MTTPARRASEGISGEPLARASGWCRPCATRSSLALAYPLRLVDGSDRKSDRVTTTDPDPIVPAESLDRRCHGDRVPRDHTVGQQVQAHRLVHLFLLLPPPDLAPAGEEQELPQRVQGLALVNLGVDPPPELFALQVSQDEDRLQGGDAGMADQHGQHPPPGWMVLELESRVKDTGCCFRDGFQDGILAVLRGDQGAARWV